MPRLSLGQKPDAVEFNVILYRNQQILPAVNDSCRNHRGRFCLHGDLHTRRFDLHDRAAGDILGSYCITFSYRIVKHFLKPLFECVSRDAALIQQVVQFMPAEFGRLRLVFFLFYQLINRIRNRSYRFKIAVASKRLLNDFGKKRILILPGHRHVAAQHLIHEFRMPVILMPRKIQCRVNIRRIVGNRRKQESDFGCLYAERVMFCDKIHACRVKIQALLDFLHRADAAQKELVNQLGCVIHLASVPCDAGQVIYAVRKCDQILPVELQMVDDPSEKGVQLLFACKVRAEQSVELYLLAAVRFLGERKLHAVQCFAGLTA